MLACGLERGSYLMCCLSMCTVECCKLYTGLCVMLMLFICSTHLLSSIPLYTPLLRKHSLVLCSGASMIPCCFLVHIEIWCTQKSIPKGRYNDQGCIKLPKVLRRHVTSSACHVDCKFKVHSPHYINIVTLRQSILVFYRI